MNRSRSLSLWRATLTALSLASLVFAVWASSYWEQLMPARAGTLAATLSAQDVEHRSTILAMEGDSPLARAGARGGDRIKPDHIVELADHYFSIDEVVGITLTSGTQQTHLLLRPIPDQTVLAQATAAQMDIWLTIAVGFLAVIIGTLIGWRRGDSPAMRALALILIVSMGVDSFRYILPIGAVLDAYYRFVNPIQFILGYVLFVLFTLIYPADRPIWRHGWVRAAFYAYLACFAAFTACKTAMAFEVFPSRWSSASTGTFLSHWSMALACVSVIASLLPLVVSWWQAAGVARQRLGWISACMGSIYVAWFFLNLVWGLGLSVSVITSEVLTKIVESLSLLGFGYALLRHRLFDFGFAVNRALVVTIISSMLLVVFSITEWGVDKLLDFEGREKNVVIDALVALGVILSFHRIQHWVKHRVDHTFFQHWHKAAEKLRHFLDKAAHVSQASALRDKFMQAILEFSGAQGAAIYSLAASGNFERQMSTLDASPETIDANDDVVIDLMHQGTLVDLDDQGRPWSCELAFPMMVRGRLNGLVLLGARTTGDQFRPDQLALLSTAVHQYGLDIETLRVEAMARRIDESESIAKSLKHEVDALRDHLHDLRANNDSLRATNESLRALVDDAKLLGAG
jgi:hypothetical protein